MKRHSILSTFVLAAVMAATPAVTWAGVFFSITIAPPALPVYAQPICPGDGYIWTPGYWAYGPAGYYWVPGSWVLAPQIGYLWTPGYWGFSGGYYAWHAGYWGPHVGFYGGINYGFGYSGSGYGGGYWSGNHFAYNRSVNNVNITNVHNVYNKTVVNNVTNNVTVNRVSYNGPGGATARPTPMEQQASREQHFNATNIQAQHERAASSNRSMLASVNNGRPAPEAFNRSQAQNYRSTPMAAATTNGHGVPPNRQAGYQTRPTPQTTQRQFTNNAAQQPANGRQYGSNPVPAASQRQYPAPQTNQRPSSSNAEPANQRQFSGGTPSAQRPQQQPRVEERPNAPRERGGGAPRAQNFPQSFHGQDRSPEAHHFSSARRG